MSSYKNLLPFDGSAVYISDVWSKEMAENQFETLQSGISWKQDEVMMFGKKIVTKREVAWYGDRKYNYTYSKISKKALLWSPDLLEIKHKVESICQETFQTCLLNLYHDGTEGMSWHSDNESDLKYDGTIASVSFGARRKFVCKHKTLGTKVEILLDPGSLLIMSGPMQRFWLHSLPKSLRVKSPRINLTFRQMQNV